MNRTSASVAAAAGIAAALFASSSPAEVVGRVLMSAGDSSAVRDGRVVPLNYGSTIEDRDLLQTGPRSNLQVRFQDSSIMSLRSGTRLRIDEFRYAAKPGATESAFFRLLKGGFRAVTGLIGRSDRSRYGVATAVATIGIRGTMYAAALCDKDCFREDGTPAPDGLYGMVMGPSHGTNEISLKNESQPDPFVIEQGQIFHIASDRSRPEFLFEPPSHLLDELAGAGKANRPTMVALGGTGGGEGAGGPAGLLAAGGIGSDSRPNALPGPLDQVATTTTGSQTIQLGNNLSGSGIPLALPPVSGGGFVAIGGTGVVRGQMLWTTTADMDLHMFTPDAQEVYFGNTVVHFPTGAATATATLDVDNTAGIAHPTAVTTFDGTLHAVENIQVTGTSVPAGNYTFFVRNFSGATTAPVLLVTGDSGVTSRRYDIPSLTGGATSSNFIVTRSAGGTASYSPP